MQLHPFLTGLGRPLSLVGRLASATGFTITTAFFGLLALTVTVYRNERIEDIGPLHPEPAIPVVLLVPLLLSIACGIAHSTWTPPVIRRNRRVQAARAASYITALALSFMVLTVGDLFSTQDTFSGTTRNLLLMTGTTMTTTALIGITYTWVPVVILTGAGLLSPANDEPWTISGMLFLGQATPGQLTVAALVCISGLALVIWDPMSRGYLKPVAGRSAS